MLVTLRRALRSLARAPAFSLAVLGTLVLGVGSATAMFAILYGVLLAPLPFGDPGRLVAVGLEARAPELRRIELPAVAYPIYKSAGLADVGFYRTGNGNIAGGESNEIERVTATWITASTIPTLAVAPLLGRPFTEEEDRSRGPEAVILSESVWRGRFHSDSAVVGKILTVNSVPRRIVG